MAQTVLGCADGCVNARYACITGNPKVIHLAEKRAFVEVPRLMLSLEPTTLLVEFAPGHALNKQPWTVVLAGSRAGGSYNLANRKLTNRWQEDLTGNSRER
jgi:hypothetical protein